MGAKAKKLGQQLNNLTTLYIKVSRGYTPKGKTEKKYYQSTKKRNLLLRNKVRTTKIP
jgi:hypothetical protein